MAKPKGSPKTGGRQTGTPNKLTLAAKEAFEYAFDKSGGQEALTTWAKANRTDFYKIFQKLIPARQELTGANGGPVEISERYAGYTDADLDKMIRDKVAAIGIAVADKV